MRAGNFEEMMQYDNYCSLDYAGRNCRTRLARPNSQARTRTVSRDHEQDWQPYPVDPYSCYMCDYTCIEHHRILLDYTVFSTLLRRGRACQLYENSNESETNTVRYGTNILYKDINIHMHINTHTV